jgi:transposase
MELLPIYEQLLNLPTVAITHVEVKPKTVLIDCQSKQKIHTCPTCGKLTSTVNQYYTRTLRDLNMGPRQVQLRVSVRQFWCKECPRYFTETLDFADLGKEHTHRQADYMFCLARKQSYTEVAAIVDTSPKTVERVVLAHCERLIDLPARYARVRRLGIDEQSHRKGKKNFFCVLTDLDRGTLLDLLPNRKKESLVAHFEKLGPAFCQQITDVSCDYWDGYIGAAQQCFPQANLILDRFHVVKLLNGALDTFRRERRRTDGDNAVFKRLKWVLYKQYHTLSDAELDDLDAAFVQSPTLKAIYWTRESFHHVLDNSTSVEQALSGLETWMTQVSRDGLSTFDKFVKTLTQTKGYIANYVRDYLSNAVTEGLNNLIRSIRRTAFGMTNFNNLRLRVLAISD